MERFRVYADFNNADQEGRIRLNCQGTLDDLHTMRKSLSQGLEVIISDGELQADATIIRSEEEDIWVAVINWDKIKR